ncbi:phosphotransferase [Rhodobacteraceae bacterium HSP-20]|uniref:Phosphotransferase n=1 Tax=Paragemmobacter amnigenus TaxID=2852097 RepID=A0ABS6J8H5_9RHOB|nr:phosphotransferase [Rhodobacter amnigenus]MBV4391268.1 phosphotransferase [Rhodobacter amnigenus]
MSDATADVHTTEFDDKIAAAIAKVPGWNDPGTTWRWLTGGGAHKNFLVTKADGQTKAVLKLWNRDWEKLGVVPPSAVPMLNTVDAGRAGIGAPVIAIVDEPLSLMIEFLPGRPIDFKDAKLQQRVARKARDLHDSGLNFRRDFNPFAEARVMLSSAGQHGAVLPADYSSVLPVLERIEKTLDMRLGDFVPSHNDLYSPNLLEQADGTIRLIDYDLSGNSDRCYDLGLMATFEGLDPDEMDRLAEAYFGEPNRRMRARMEMFAIAANYSQFAIFAAALVAAEMNADYDYEGYMASTWTKILGQINDPRFGAFLAEV